jgi:hypothetical protein
MFVEVTADRAATVKAFQYLNQIAKGWAAAIVKMAGMDAVKVAGSASCWSLLALRAVSKAESPIAKMAVCKVPCCFPDSEEVLRRFSVTTSRLPPLPFPFGGLEMFFSMCCCSNCSMLQLLLSEELVELDVELLSEASLLSSLELELMLT